MSQANNTYHRLPMFQGLFYEPCRKRGLKKHQCPDCHFCQECSPTRCSVCREAGSKPGGKLSLQEQIALYERINNEP